MIEGKTLAMVVDGNDEYCDDVCEDNNTDDVILEIEEYEVSEAMQELDEDLSKSLNQMVLRLCSICANFFKGKFKSGTANDIYIFVFPAHPYNVRVHHSSLTSLQRSVRYGCPLCRELFRNLQELLDKRPEYMGRSDDSFSIGCELEEGSSWQEMKGLQANFLLLGPRGQHLEEKDHDSIVNLQFHPANTLGLGPEFRDPTLANTAANSKISTDLARSWYHNCLRHEGCRNFDKSSACTPTRLVRIQESSHGASSSVTASLVETKDLPKETPCHYVTLSHRWGGLSMTQLREGNLNAFRREIPVHQLPQLFRDAFFMTRQLGIDYIWIDCLCIIQGSKADWALEAMRMGDYYRFAECNLAASGYPDTTHGVFGQREALQLLNYPIQLDLTLVVRGAEIQHTGIYVRKHDDEFSRTISQGPLSSRGWIAQERALSPGVLHFTPKQMWWECNERLVNEAFSNTTMSWRSKFAGSGSVRSVNAKLRREQIYSSWDDFVQSYAGTDLTVETDRFPAAAGIAKIYASLLDDNLIAGFWEGNLVPSLVWHLDDKAKRIPSVQVAPSWSWVSVCMAFKLPVFAQKVISGVNVLVLSDIPGFESDLNPPVLEKSGVRGLSVRGPLRTIPPEPECWFKSFDCVVSVFMHHDWDDFGFFKQQNISDDQKWRWQSPTHLLPLTHSGLVRHFTIGCLLLQQVTGEDDPMTFRRLGQVKFRIQSKEWEEVFGLRQENGEYKPSLIFEECGLQDLVLI